MYLNTLEHMPPVQEQPPTSDLEAIQCLLGARDLCLIIDMSGSMQIPQVEATVVVCSVDSSSLAR